MRVGSAASSDADRRKQVIAFAWISGLVMLAIGFWLVAILTSDAGDRIEIADGAESTSETSASGDDANDPNGARADTDGTDADAASNEGRDAQGGDDQHAQDDDVAAGSNDDADADADEQDGDEQDGDTATVTIDGQCSVELTAEERDDAARLRPWDFPDCTYAPITVAQGRERWIVVRASMASDTFDAPAAEERADELGVDGGVLWSSHYPSLNPDLWVVYEGPFRDAEAARAAADAVVGEGYARALTVDDDDRYCIAADGCVGEGAD